jgi:hypothetical protein
MILSLIMLLAQNAFGWSLDYNMPKYYHEWNWSVGHKEEITYAKCRQLNGVVNKWKAKEKNAGDFWNSSITCKSMKSNGNLDSNSMKDSHFEYSGSGDMVNSEVNSNRIPVGVKLKYKKWNGTKKVIDFTLIQLPIEQIGQCATDGYNAGWATRRNSSNHEVITLFCNCGAMTALDVIKKKPNLSAPEITGVRIQCNLVEYN